MLVVTRREGESVVIGDPRNPLGRVKLVRIDRDRVRLGFEFPRQIDVHRSEVVDEILAGDDAAAAGGSRDADMAADGAAGAVARELRQ